MRPSGLVVEMPPPRGEDETLESLVANVLRHAQATVEPSDTSRVVLDVEEDGIRCVLLCKERQTMRVAPLLSPREQEIARMVARGLPNKVIASVLEISPWTVGTHLRRMFAKLGVTSRAAMIARLMEDTSLKP